MPVHGKSRYVLEYSWEHDAAAQSQAWIPAFLKTGAGMTGVDA